MSKTSLLKDQWLNQALTKVKRAEKRGELERATNLYAVKASYDSKKRLIVILLANGSSFSFPPKLAEGLARKSADSLSSIEISPFGTGLRWPKLDVDLTVEGLLSGVFGGSKWSLKSHLANAARENGARGGRPKSIHI